LADIDAARIGAIVCLIQEQHAADLQTGDATLGDRAQGYGGCTYAVTSGPSSSVIIVAVSPCIGTGVHQANVSATQADAGIGASKHKKSLIRPRAAQRNIRLVVEDYTRRQIVNTGIQRYDLSIRTGRNRRVDLCRRRTRIQRGTYGSAVGNASDNACLAPVDRAARIENARPELRIGTELEAEQDKGE